jgi:hypothetical protein
MGYTQNRVDFPPNSDDCAILGINNRINEILGHNRWAGDLV